MRRQARQLRVAGGGLGAVGRDFDVPLKVPASQSCLHHASRTAVQAQARQDRP